jgi:hypothetical protein
MLVVCATEFVVLCFFLYMYYGWGFFLLFWFLGCVMLVRLLSCKFCLFLFM